MTAPTFVQPVRCAIYTRVSVASDDGAMGSIELQRDICTSYVRSQRQSNWSEIAKRYDDQGHSGGTLERPALRRLLADVEEGHVDQIVIYKLDRLTRSLTDFVRLIDLLQQYGVAFVSVTQAFDTRDTLGRLILNILLTFAQFEREMISDRIRDSVARRRRAGLFTGGAPPFGYDLVRGRLIVNDAEAAIVREIFERYLEVESSNLLTREFQERGLHRKSWVNRKGTISGGGLASRGMIYPMLANPAYIGEFHFQGEVFQAQHAPIIERELWDRVQILRNSRMLKQLPPRPHDNLLLGLLYDDLGRRMRTDKTWARDRPYFYYFSDPNHRASKLGVRRLRVRCDDVEQIVLKSICGFLRDRFRLSAAIHSLGKRSSYTDRLIGRGQIAARHLEGFDRRRLRFAYDALVDRIELSNEAIRIILRCEQLATLLAWEGNGLFRDRTPQSTKHHAIFVVETSACPVRSERAFKLLSCPRLPDGKVNKGLIELLRLARTYQAELYDRQGRTLDQIAACAQRRPAFISRVLRLNYLAPDIQIAIMDGHQPVDLTRRMLLFSAIPTDWSQQRELLGFPAQRDPKTNDEYY